MALTEKQKAFVEEYLVDLNATHAAIRAGYSERTAYSKGNALLRHPEVATEIATAKLARSERTRVDADWLLARLAAEVEADIADLYDDNGALKPVKEWPEIWRKGLVAGLDVEEIKADGRTVGLIRKVKLSDRTRRLEMIGKHIDVAAFTEKHEHTGEGGGPMQVVVKRYAGD